MSNIANEKIWEDWKINVHHLYTGIFLLPGFIDLQGENTLDALNGLEQI